MKFLVKEHKSIVKIFDEQNVSPEDYTFRKKGGQLFIELKGKIEPFCYYRKKESTLNGQMQFEDKLTYFVGLKKEVVLESWEEVLLLFEKWI